ncbi:hypothetical protein ERJ70_09770 [Sediminibacillus dalangtanensis]|uniref:Uncharacterized protein n=1 Tax=Sediminibacillus dalangtanensis TaxID=2729421 RepID=A0ABX7VRL3_9BACI|nr:hypothetical protein [Sediminibacillus dalangtanensis]QTM99561.1 hypothetical protein ERJ70_09770 [Sediminibacillus dalangtanensis]
MVIAFICLAIVLIALVIGAVMGNRARKGIQSELNRMSQTMAPLQQEMNEMKQQSSVLSEKQSSIQHYIQKSKSDIQETIQTFKEIPGMYKEMFSTNSDQTQTPSRN